MSDAEQAAFKAVYRERRALAREVGTLYEFSSQGAMEVSAEEREAEYQRRWNLGGVNFVHAFNDLMVNKASNDTIADFVRARIRAIVTDPEVAESLCPIDHPLGTKRICVDTGYYETFNQAHVRLVDLKKTPIERFTAGGVRIAGESVALDMLVCATGYDALTGALTAIDIRGRGGVSLREQWAAGPRTLLGLMTAGFPNLFIITGPGSPSVLVNMVVGIEHHVDWIVDCVDYMKAHGFATIEADRLAQDRWVEHVDAAARKTLLPMANSWFLGANVPGKPRVFLPYVSKMGAYRRECQACADEGYEGFTLGPIATAS
jgi:cyclohexanone monooxygenase